MSSIKGGSRSSSRGRGSWASGAPKGPAAGTNNNQTRTPRAGFTNYSRGRGNTQQMQNGRAGGGLQAKSAGGRGRVRDGNKSIPTTTLPAKGEGLASNAASYQDRFQAVGPVQPSPGALSRSYSNSMPHSSRRNANENEQTLLRKASLLTQTSPGHSPRLSLQWAPVRTCAPSLSALKE